MLKNFAIFWDIGPFSQCVNLLSENFITYILGVSNQQNKKPAYSKCLATYTTTTRRYILEDKTFVTTAVGT